jgi:hypothetical protein
MSADPYDGSAALSNPQSWNRYSYVGNDPVNRNDPTGLQDEGPPWTLCNLNGFVHWGPMCDDAISGRPSRRRHQITPFELALQALDTAAERLQNRSSFSADCVRGLEAIGITPQQLQDAGTSITFKNGTTSPDPISNLNIGGFAQAGNAQQFTENRDHGRSWLTPWTISDEFAANPGLIAQSQRGGPTPVIYISGERINYRVDQQGLLMHELLHWATGKDDTAIQDALGLGNGASENIGNSLRQNCVRGPGNN